MPGMERANDVAGRALRARNDARCQRILDSAAPLVTGDLRWDDVGRAEIPSAAIDSLVYMRDVEGFTDSYLRGIAAHRTTLRDPLIGRFLPIWQSDEAGHAEAIARYLGLYGERRRLDIPVQPPSPTAPVPIHERILSQIGGPFGCLVAAAHMTWGASNELLTLNGYRLLAVRCDDPVLRELLSRIAAQEARHYSFYLLQAEWRLASSPLARSVLRRLLRGSWTPVGIGEGYKTAAEFRCVLDYLGVGTDGQRVIDQMDRRISALPGLAELHIFRSAASAVA